VAVDLLLITLAVRHVESGPREQASSQRAATPSPGGATSSDVPTAEPLGGDPSTTSDALPAPVDYVAIGPDSSLLRASRGDCAKSTTPTVEVSIDNGKTFDGGKVPDLGEVLDARAISGKQLMLIGLDPKCAVGRYTSDDGGKSWNRRAGAGGTWHLSADRTALTVATPQGPRGTPCLVRAVSTMDDSVVRLLCDDGTILGTDDVGQTWVSLGKLAGAVDIRFTSPADGVALAKQPGCAAAVMQSFDGGSAWKQLTCLPGKRPRAIDSQGSIVAAQVGKQHYVSTDGGSTWPGPAGG